MLIELSKRDPFAQKRFENLQKKCEEHQFNDIKLYTFEADAGSD